MHTYTYTSLYYFLDYFLTMSRVRRIRVRTFLTLHPISTPSTILSYTYNLPLVTVSDLTRTLVTVHTYMLNTHHGYLTTSGLLTVSSCCLDGCLRGVCPSSRMSLISLLTVLPLMATALVAPRPPGQNVPARVLAASLRTPERV